MADEPSDAQPAALRAMSFNIRYDNPSDGANAWPHRKDWVAEIIRDQSVAVAGLQEAIEHQVRDLAERLPEYAWFGVGREGGERGEYCPIFYVRDRFEVLDSETVWLSPTPEQPGSRGWDAALPRIATRLRLRDRQQERTWTIWNTHFDHVGRLARENSARLIIERLGATPAGDALVVMGDLNSQLDDKPLSVLLSAWQLDGQQAMLRDARAAAEEVDGPDSTWCGFRAVVPGQRIDHILVGPRTAVSRYAALVLQRDGRFPSDHLPIIADLVPAAARP